MSKQQKPFVARLSIIGKHTIRLNLVGDHIVVTCTKNDSMTIYRHAFDKDDIDQANECFNECFHDIRLLTEIKATLKEKRRKKK